MRMRNALHARFSQFPLSQAPLAHALLSAVPVIGLALTGLFLMTRPQDMAGGMAMHDTTHVVIWLLACRLLPIASAGVGIVLIVRMARSGLWQHAQTQAALRPLLAQLRIAAPACLTSLLQRFHLDERTAVIACEFPVALCYGLFRPHLLFSTAAIGGLSIPELEALLRHEQVHLRRRDPLRRLLLRAMTEALPLAALQDVTERMPLAQELAADRAVLMAVGPEALSGALLKVGDALDTLQDARIAVGAFSAIDARIDQILESPCVARHGTVSMALPSLMLALLVSGPLLCLLLPFPTPLFWISGVAAVANWRRLRLLSGLFAYRRG